MLVIYFLSPSMHAGYEQIKVLINAVWETCWRTPELWFVAVTKVVGNCSRLFEAIS